MSKLKQVHDYLSAHPDALVNDIAKAVGMTNSDVAARLCALRDKGVAVSEEAGRSLSNRPVLRWRLTGQEYTRRPYTRAPKQKEYVSSPPKQEANISLDALVESMAEGLVTSLVARVKAKLPAALAGVTPAAHLTLPAPAPVAVVLPAPEPTPAPRAYKPAIGVVGLLPQQAGSLQEKFGGSLDIRFWNDGDDKGRLRSIAENCEAVFLHTRHSGHHTDQLLKTYSANLRRVTGGTSNMEVAIRGYFVNKETSK